MTWKIAVGLMVAPPVLSLLLFVIVRIIWPFAKSWRANLASKFGDDSFRVFANRALIPGPMQLQGGIYGWYWLLGRVAIVVALVGVFVGFSSWGTVIWLVILSGVSKALLRSHLLESRRVVR